MYLQLHIGRDIDADVMEGFHELSTHLTRFKSKERLNDEGLARVQRRRTAFRFITKGSELFKQVDWLEE